MNRKKIEQIKALLDTGFSEHQIRDILNATDDEILQAMGVENIEEKPKDKPKAEEPKIHKLKRVGRNGTKIDEESFNLIKQDLENGMKREKIFEKYGIANALYYKVKKSPTFKDFCDLRKIETKKKKSTKSDVLIENINKARAVAIENRREKGRETYLKYKELLKNRTMSYGKFANEYGISPTTAWKIDNSDTVEDYLKSIDNENGKKRSTKKPFKRNQTEQLADASVPELDPKLVELRSIADSAERMAEALESIKELMVYKKRGFFRK